MSLTRLLTGVGLALTVAVMGPVPTSAATDDLTLRVFEDDWLRAATTAIQDTARGQGIATTGPAVAAIAPGRGSMTAMRAADGTLLLHISRATARLRSGLYLVAPDGTGRVALFHFDPAKGRVKADVRVPPGDPTGFHTPIGDDMCRNADDLLMDFCQTFVACAAYDFFC